MSYPLLLLAADLNHDDGDEHSHYQASCAVTRSRLLIDGSASTVAVAKDDTHACNLEDCYFPLSTERGLLNDDDDNGIDGQCSTNFPLIHEDTSLHNSIASNQPGGRHLIPHSGFYYHLSPSRAGPSSRRHLLGPGLSFSSAMAVAAADPLPLPGSPPDLSSSRSSKSSFHSSLDEIAETTDNSHFEDINLQEMTMALPDDYVNFGHDRNQKKWPSSKTRHGPPPSASVIVDQRRDSKSKGSRDLMNGSRPKYPSLKGQVNGILRESQHQSHHYPRQRGQHHQARLNPRAPRHNSSSPSTSALVGTLHTPRSAHSRSRSTSPNISPRSFTGPAQSMFRSTSPLRNEWSPAVGPPVRRGSWQPSRKTTKELEDEYHDSDEDVPEDAVIWNVPLSPRTSHQRSASQSPEPGFAAAQPETASVQAKHASAPAVLPCGRGSSSPRVAARHDSWQSPNMTTSPDRLSFSQGMQKSWTAALSDLSEEAKVLTEALEVYAEEQEKRQDENNKTREGRRATAPQRPKPQAVELPPVRKGNIMIDPLPVSKEKEKFLTRTRPSWLPPKNPKEERRHLREYQQMMAHSQEAEKRRTAKLEQERLARETTESSFSRIWDEHVLPNWSAAISEPRTRELWWRGVTPRSRGIVWAQAIGNDLGLTRASYEAALGRARAAEKRIQELEPDDRRGVREADWFEAIERDVADTFLELGVFQKGGSKHDALVDLLKAYAMYRSDVGHVFGTHLPAALLTLVQPEPHQSFTTLANLLNRALPLSFLTADAGAMSRVHSLVLTTLAYKRPALHARLTSTLQLPPATFLDPLFRSLFLARCGVETAARIWDVYVFEGDRALIRAAVGVLLALECRLWGSKEEVLDTLGWKRGWENWDLGGEDGLMKFVREAGKVEDAAGRRKG